MCVHSHVLDFNIEKIGLHNVAAFSLSIGQKWDYKCKAKYYNRLLSPPLSLSTQYMMCIKSHTNHIQ